MSDRLPNAYSGFPNNFPQAPPTQQAQHRPLQQPQQAGSQPPLVGISNEMWQLPYRHQQQQQQQPQQQQQQQPQPQQQQQQQQAQQSGGEPMHGGVMNLTSHQQQFLLALRSQVAQGHMTQQQALERLAMMQASSVPPFQEQTAPQQLPTGFNAGQMSSATTQQQITSLSQRGQVSTNNQALQRVIQDPSHARQFSMLLPHAQQQQQNGSGLASRMGQNLNPPGMSLPQGPGTLQQNFIQPSPSLPHANPQPPSAASASQPQPGAHQVSVPGNLNTMPLQQLRVLSTQLLQIVMESEKNLPVVGTSGENDIQRQLRLKVENNKRYLRMLQEVISARTRASGDPTQQAVSGQSWPGTGQRPTGLYPVAERSGQHNSPSLHQASANQAQSQRGIPTPQQNFVSSATPQSNLTQISSHVSANGLPGNGVLAQINGAPPQQSPQITHPPSQQPIQPNKLPPLSEERFKANFMQFLRSKGIRLNEGDLAIEGRPINLWALHRTVFSRNGFESVSARDEWPVIGAALGLPTTGDASRPPRCAPAIANRLQQLYNEVLRHFDQVYISSIIARLRSSQASGQLPPQPPQPQAQLHQPTEADYQALLGSTSESSVMDSEAMSILPRFSHTSGADLEAHHVPAPVIAFVEQNRERLQRAAQDQNGFRAGLTTKNPPLDNRTQVNHASALQAVSRPPQFMPGQQQMQQLQRQGPVQGTGKPAQLFNNVGPLVPSSTAQSISTSSIPAMGTQTTGSISSGGVQNQGGSMSISMNPAAMNGVTSGSQPAIRRPTQEELINAKRWVDEKKRVAFSSAPDVNGVAVTPIPESEIQEYHRNVERLDQVLANIEKYIHFAFAVLKKEEIVERMFIMMASVKIQMEELKKPNPRYVLELHAIRGMIQEADNMDKGLKAVLQRTQAQVMPPGGVPSTPQPPPQPPSATAAAALFAQSPAAPPAPTVVPRSSHAPPLQPAHRKKPSQAQAAISSPTPPPIPTASTPTPQAATPGITAPSPQTPKSPKGKAAAKPKAPTRRKGSTKANNVETPTPVQTVASTPTSSTPVDAKGGGKRTRDDADAATPGVTSAPSPKRVKPDWEGPPNEEARKRDEQAENVHSDEQAMALFENVTKFIDENPESAEAASNALDAILRIYPSAPDIDDTTIPPSYSFGDLPPTSPPHPMGHDIFVDYINYSAFDDPTPELVAGSSTNPSPESASDQDHPHTGRAGPSPQISNAKPDDTCELLRPAMWKDISGGDTMIHQAQGWKWEGPMVAPDQPWAISTS